MTTSVREKTGWVGWIYFAGIMMILSGCLNIIYGIAAIANNEWEIFDAEGVLLLDISGWGWLHLAIGIFVLIAGIVVFRGSMFGRSVGVILACVSLIANFIWLPAYPIWSIIIIVLDVLVIWALTAHGDELKPS